MKTDRKLAVLVLFFFALNIFLPMIVLSADEEAAEEESIAVKKKETRELKEGDTITLQKGTVVKLELVENLSSQDNRTGDIIHYAVTDDVVVDDYVVIKKGAEALGQVVTAKAAKGWGKSGKLEISVETVQGVNGKKIPLAATMGEGKNWAAGKTIIGVAALGLLFGGGMKGKKVHIDKGTTLEVFVAEDTEFVAGDQKTSGATKDSSANTCFKVCENEEGDAFKTCMSACDECRDVCKDLSGDTQESCLIKCIEK